MQAFPIRDLSSSLFPPLLHEIPDKPKSLRIQGADLPSQDQWKYLAVVGSRAHTQYGKRALDHLIKDLAGYPVAIVSGLALGVDALAHKAALAYRLPTVAVPGSGLGASVLYPRLNRGLAREILEAGGSLLSEYDDDFRAVYWSFPERNRIMAGMSHATLVIEASEKSGTLITARLAMEYNREVLVVPGEIFSEASKGSHKLLRDGATLVRSAEDILESLGIESKAAAQETLFPQHLSDDEQALWTLLAEPRTRDDLIASLQLPAYKFNILISSLELKNLITEQLGKIYRK